MASVTIETLTTRVRQRADFENSQFVTDEEILTHINASLGELWELLVAAAPEFYVNYQVISPTGAEAGLFDMPDDYFGTVGVDYELSTGQWIALTKIMLSERNNYDYSIQDISQGYTFDRSTPAGTSPFPKLHLLPHPRANHTYRHVYTMAAPTLEVGGTESVDGINGFEEYIVIDVAIKLLSKEESPTGVYERQKDAMTARLLAAAELRTLTEAGRVSDHDGSSVYIVDPADYRWYH
jgi:hypothetical protein